MKEFVYPAIFHPNDDGSFTITFPDLEGCISEGKSLGNAIHMAQDALKQWVAYLSEINAKIPVASKMRDIQAEGDEIVTLVRAELKDNHAVRRTVSIPKWMDEKASASGLSLSRVLQDALADRIG